MGPDIVWYHNSLLHFIPPHSGKFAEDFHYLEIHLEMVPGFMALCVIFHWSTFVRATLIPKDKATPEERKIAETMRKECKMLLRVMSVIRVS